MLSKVKTALRISHDKLDDEIMDTINTARAELIRSGCDLYLCDEDIMRSAIITYCKYAFASDDKKKEGFWQSFQYQEDCLRKSKGGELSV